jgi:O-antigen/teichoic acid export membrane protein
MASDADAHRLVVRGGSSAAIGFVIRLGARLLFLFLAARLFGAALFGAFSLAVAAVELAVAVGALGMKRYLFQLLAEKSEERPAAHVLLDAALLVAIASAFLAAALMLAATALPEPNTALALLLVAPMVVGQALLDLFLAATRWTQRMRWEVTARSIIEPYAGIAALGAAFALGFDSAGLVISYWAGTLAALAYAAWGARLCLGRFQLASYRISPARLARTARATMLPAATDFTLALFGRIDLYLVGLLLGEAPAGIYNMARQIRTPIRQVRQSLDGMLTPLLARTLAARGPQETALAAASATRLMLALQLPALLGLVVIGTPLLAWLGPEFIIGYNVLVILAAAETILGAFGVSELILFYRRPAGGLWVTWTSLLFYIAAALLLVPQFGLEGAAWAVLIAVSVGALIRRQLLRTGFEITVPLSHASGPILAAMVAAVPALLLPHHEAGEALTALIAVFATYWLALRLWQRLTGQSLALEKLQAD